MGKRKLHEFINNIEHKHCGGGCNQWKPLSQFGKFSRSWDRLFYSCSNCTKKKTKQRRKSVIENRKKARDNAPTGYSVCLNPLCAIIDPKQWLQPTDEFDSAYVHTHTLTLMCLTCRSKSLRAHSLPNTILKACQNIWNDWRRTHPCLVCSQNSDYKHHYLVIEADHLPEFEKITDCSRLCYWSTKSRGLPALKAELNKCQALCRFHHHIQTQQRNRGDGRIEKAPGRIKKRAIINAEKHKRGCCLTCKRIVKKGEECGFSFDHRDPTTKFIRNGKAISPGQFVSLPQALFHLQWPLEQAKCDLLCANCDKLKTFANRDGYKN
jgi:hypothetical protein